MNDNNNVFNKALYTYQLYWPCNWSRLGPLLHALLGVKSFSKSVFSKASSLVALQAAVAQHVQRYGTQYHIS